VLIHFQGCGGAQPVAGVFDFIRSMTMPCLILVIYTVSEAPLLTRASDDELSALCFWIQKSVPQLKIQAKRDAACSLLKIGSLRNASGANLLKYREKRMDCKSTYAGSIPTSASTFKKLCRSMIYRAFLFAEQ
jgi:hypothetical protein